MKMRTKTNQELKDSGCVYIATNQMGLEVWAKFSGYEDIVQYVDQKEGFYTSDVQTISFSQLCLFEIMLKTLNFKQFFQQDIKVDNVWTNDNYSEVFKHASNTN